MMRRLANRRRSTPVTIGGGAALGCLLALAAPAQSPPPAQEAAAAPAPAAPADVRAGARRALERFGPAVVTVRVVLKRRFIAQGRERGSVDAQLEVAGTILSPAGLTVVSDATTDPSALSTPSDTESRIETETTDVKLVLRDGRELPARFVLRDRDLDLAFLVPDQAGLVLPHVDFGADPAPLPEALDALVYIFPLGRSLGREAGIALDYARGIVRKPRTFVASDLVIGMQSLGCPVFDSAGRPLGLSVMRRAPRTASSGGSFRDVFDAFTPVVLTAADLSSVARQALEHAATQPGQDQDAEEPGRDGTREGGR